jgi:hypothetical protein
MRKTIFTSSDARLYDVYAILALHPCEVRRHKPITTLTVYRQPPLQRIYQFRDIAPSATASEWRRQPARIEAHKAMVPRSLQSATCRRQTGTSA